MAPGQGEEAPVLSLSEGIRTSHRPPPVQDGVSRGQVLAWAPPRASSRSPLGREAAAGNVLDTRWIRCGAGTMDEQWKKSACITRGGIISPLPSPQALSIFSSHVSS